jgi:SAM-dependent methyltransferase
MAKRLVNSLPPDGYRTGSAGAEALPVIDVGAGSGLLSREISNAIPHSEIHAVEPAEEMLGLARKRLKGRRVHFHRCPAEDIASLPIRADAALSNAAFHLVDLEKVFQALSAVLLPGGRIVFNLWWHAFDETAGDDASLPSRRVIEELLREYGLPYEMALRSRPPLDRAAVDRYAERAGLAVESVTIDRDEIGQQFFLDFMKMYPDRPHPDLPSPAREEFYRRATEMLGGKTTTITSVRFSLLKR